MNTLHAIYEVIQIEKKKTPDTTEILDKLRNVLEPYIYFYLIEIPLRITKITSDYKYTFLFTIFSRSLRYILRFFFSLMIYL